MRRRPSLPPRRQASLFAPPIADEPAIAIESKRAIVEVLADLLLEAAGRSGAKGGGDESEDDT